MDKTQEFEQLQAKDNEVKIYFVRHAESCSNIISFASSLGNSKITHPPLSYKGIQQAINLGINNEIINKDFDKYYCSPSLRTIMTACLALRKKSHDKVITLILNPYLIEKQNISSNFELLSNTQNDYSINQDDDIREQNGDIHEQNGDIFDQQNSIVPKQNLMNMINYIKLWFDQKYFNNYIDYEFVNLMYNLVLLLYFHFKNKLTESLITKIKDLLIRVKENKKVLLNEFIQIIKTTIKDGAYTKLVNKIYFLKISVSVSENENDIYNKLLFFIDNIIITKITDESIDISLRPEIIKIKEHTETISVQIIIDQLELFTQENFFMKNIIIDYTYKDNQEHISDIQKFITNEILPLNSNQTILCFTHGLTLFERFKLSSKLQNTEIICYDVNKNTNKQIFNNNIIIDKQLIINTCGNILSDKLPDLLKLVMSFITSNDFKMFKVINNYFNDSTYKITTDENIMDDFKVDFINEDISIAETLVEAKSIEANIAMKEATILDKVVKDITEILEDKDKVKAISKKLVIATEEANKAISEKLVIATEEANKAISEKLIIATEEANKAKIRANKAIKDHEEAFIALNRERKAAEDLKKNDDSDKDYHLAGGRYKYKYKRRYKLINKLVNVDDNNNNYIYQLVKLN
jgi:broad specificity phosphatase PhoE